MMSKSSNTSEEKQCVPTASPTDLEVQPQPIVSLMCKEGRAPHTLELLASISPPADVTQSRSGCDVCCVGKYRLPIWSC